LLKHFFTDQLDFRHLIQTRWHIAEHEVVNRERFRDSTKVKVPLIPVNTIWRDNEAFRSHFLTKNLTEAEAVYFEELLEHETFRRILNISSKVKYLFKFQTPISFV
jgi:hypothetical protein